MKSARVILFVLLAATVAWSGCRREESVDSHARIGKHGKPRTGGDGALDAGRSSGLSADQQRAVARILAAGGNIKYNSDGYPVLIDLASDRVFASADVVRACLAFPRLKRLRLAVSAVAPETLADLASLEQLSELMLQGAAVTDRDVAAILAAIPQLRRLTLRRLSRVTDAVIDAMRACPRLEVIALIEMNQLTGAALDKLKHVAGLRSLDLRNCGLLAADDFRKLAALQQLTDLKIGGPAITDDVLAMVALHPKIRSIAVEDAEVTEASLQKLAASREFASRLRSLSFARCFGLTDESFGALDQFPGLESLMLRDIMLTGAFIGQLAESATKRSPLRVLIITNAFLSDETIAALPKVFPDLTRLDLRGNSGITDASRDVFKQLRALEDLQVAETSVSGTM